MKQIAVFGGSFNPPTLGHFDVIKQILAKDTFDKLLLVPSIAHVFGKKSAPFAMRVELLNLFLQDLKDEKTLNPNNIPIEINLCEQTLFETRKTLGETDITISTYEVLNYLQKEQEAHWLPPCQLSFIIGPDNEKQLCKFKNAKALQKEFKIVVVKETKPIRSTLLRNALQKGKELSPYTTKSLVKKLANLTYYAQ